MTHLTAELLVDRLEPSDLQVSPNARLVAFVVAPVGRAGEHKESAIWVAPVDGSEAARKLTAGTAQDHKPRWAPDSRSLYFLSDRAERKQGQVHRLPIDGGEALPLTWGKPGIETFAPLPDGRMVALLSSEPPSEDQERREKERDDPQVFGEQWRPHRLRLLDVESRAVTTLGSTGDLHVANLAPSPDGSLIAVVLWETPDYDHIARACTLAVVDPVADRLRARWTIPGGEVDLAWSSAGGELVVLGPSSSGGQVGNGLFLVGLEDQEPRLLGVARPSCPLWLAPAPLVSVAEGLDSWVGRVEGDAVVPVGPVLPGSLHYLSSSPDGGVIAALRGGPGAPYDVWAGAADGELRRVSDLNPELRRVAWGAQERLTWRASDGLELDGLLVLPAGKTREDGPFPMVTLVHGGPYWRIADDLQLSWAQPAEWLALDGFASFLPNPRGGLGHGSPFAELVHGAVGIDDWSDIVAGLDMLIGHGVADPGRLAIGGWSQGGYMSAWAVTQTDRFRAAVMGAGVSDWGMMVAESDLPTFEAALGGSTGWEGPGPHRHDELSPVSFAHRARTPTLILHGEKDERVPLGQARFFARALEAAGVPFELVVYPREPHGLEERNHLLDLLRRWREWLARWLPG